MKKQDLYNGDIVQLRDGEKYIVLKNANFFNTFDDVLIGLETGLNCPLNEYDDDLYIKPRGLSTLDIVKVCSCEYVGYNIQKHIIGNDTEDLWTWEREDDEA
ncbi:hypothetical protein [Anaerofustis stercorihominis]|uniref:Uncharacterized protein n=1 Tax=Anaerofustis stercorihominis TaxID=214853 RepID=A0A3E3DYS0_9FIRM|nr:hypothetical protein [Anaerofustis stercorihominis]RGD73848.1 hypothetical protein DW687_08720 [Anaerofustis stercorihominis]